MIKKKDRDAIMLALRQEYDRSHRDKINLLSIASKRFDYNKTIAICEILKSKGYLRFTSDIFVEDVKSQYGLLNSRKRYPTPSEKQIFVTLTDAGLSYFETQHDKKIRFILYSIITPICVAIATELILHWLLSKL